MRNAFLRLDKTLPLSVGLDRSTAGKDLTKLNESFSARVSLGASETTVNPLLCFNSRAIRFASDCQTAGTPFFCTI
jgi:hypothetical protein